MTDDVLTTDVTTESLRTLIGATVLVVSGLFWPVVSCEGVLEGGGSVVEVDVMGLEKARGKSIQNIDPSRLLRG